MNLRNRTKTSIDAVVCMLAAVTTFLMTGSAGAIGVKAVGLFELDGNADQDDTAPPPDDWETIAADTQPGATKVGSWAATTGIIADHTSTGAGDTSYFTGGGSKDVRDVSQWRYSKNDQAPDKNEITNAYAASYNSTAGDLVVYFGSDRFANDGDAQVGLWFFQNEVTKSANGSFNGVHVARTTGTDAHPGDVLVLSDFSNGGTVSTIKVYEWVGSGGSDGPLDLISNTTPGVTVDCKLITATGDVCATVNSSPTGTFWDYVYKGTGVTTSFPTGTFYEGGINLTQLLGGGKACFATFLAETRSSTSPSAQLKDFALGGFQQCRPTTDLALSGVKVAGASQTLPTADSNRNYAITVHTGELVELQFTETNNGNITLDKPTIPRYVLSADADCNTNMAEVQTAGVNVGDNGGTSGKAAFVGNGKLDPTEGWKYTCSFTPTGSVSTTVTTRVVKAYGHGIDSKSAAPGFRDVTFCAAGTTAPPSDSAVALPATVAICDPDEFVSVTLSILAPSTELTARVVATVTLFEKNDGNASLTPPTTPGRLVTAGSNCANVASVLSGGFNVGDSGAGGFNQNGLLDPGETWQYTCTITLEGATAGSSTASGSKSADAFGHGIDATNGTDVTRCTTGTSTAEDPTAISHAPGGTSMALTTKCDDQEKRSISVSIT